MPANRMFMLQFGQERVPKSLSVHGAGAHPLTEPIFGAAVETTDGWVLLDTGISRAALDDEPACTRIYGPGMMPSGPDGDPLTVALAAVGVNIEDVILAAVSHLHLDHTGGIPLLAAAGVPIAIQRDELEYGRRRADDGTEIDVAFYRRDYMRDGVNWQLLDGDADLAPGVRTFATPGHTPGHQSYGVELPATGQWILAADSADLAENILEGVPCGSVAEPADARKARASVYRVVSDAERLDARVLPGHDPIVWKAAWHPAGGHR